MLWYFLYLTGHTFIISFISWSIYPVCKFVNNNNNENHTFLFYFHSHNIFAGDDLFFTMKHNYMENFCNKLERDQNTRVLLRSPSRCSTSTIRRFSSCSVSLNQRNGSNNKVIIPLLRGIMQNNSLWIQTKRLWWVSFSKFNTLIWSNAV